MVVPIGEKHGQIFASATIGICGEKGGKFKEIGERENREQVMYTG